MRASDRVKVLTVGAIIMALVAVAVLGYSRFTDADPDGTATTPPTSTPATATPLITPAPQPVAAAPVAATPLATQAPPTPVAASPVSTPVATAEPAEDPCAPQPVTWVSIDDIDPDTWVPPPLPVVCFPEDWELATWRPDAPLVPDTPHRPWVLIDGRPIDGPPDARRLDDLRKLLFSYDQEKQAGAAATAAPGLDASYVRPWNTGRQLARIDSVYAQMRTLWEDRPYSSRELTHHDEVVAVDLRDLDAYVYSFRRGYANYARFEDTGELFAPGWVVDVAGWAERWERDPDLNSGRWLREYSRGASWANDAGLKRVLADLPDFAALVAYHRHYMAAAEAEYRVSELPRHPLLRE